MKKTYAIITGLVALALSGCSKQELTAERPTPVEVQTVKKFTGKDEKRFSAVIQPYEQVDLSFRVGGYVDHIAQVRGIENRSRALQDGDKVTKGMVLARLASTDYNARVQQAKASISESQTLLAKAQIDRDRAISLYQSKSMTKTDYDAAMSNYEATRARLDSARGRFAEANTSAGDTVLRAPFSGTVLSRGIAPGTLAAPGAPAFVLADTGVVKAVFGVPDHLLPRMRIGETLKLETEALGGRELQGKVSRVSAAADAKSRVFEVEVSIPNAKDELKVGMIATLVIEDEQPQADLPVVPISAVVSSSKNPGSYAVFVAVNEKEGTVARLVEVKLGPTVGNSVVIERGPALGDQVVTTGAGLLHEGERIDILASTVLAEKR